LWKSDYNPCPNAKGSKMVDIWDKDETA